MIKYKIPIWNGIQNQSDVSTEWLEIGNSDFNGVYSQTAKRIIEYHKNYKHMTPLKGSDYINKLRNGKIDWILKHGLKSSKILEIGGGDSFNYEYFECEKYTIVDPAIKQIKKTPRLELIADYYENVSLQEKYDCVLLISVLEHVDNPGDIIEKTAEILYDDGAIFVFIPIIEKQFALGDFNALVHEHISYFTYTGAKNLFASKGLVIDSYYFENDGGFFKLVKGNEKSSLFEPFDLNKIQYNFEYSHRKFKELISGDEKILFYGATNGLNNLFYLIGDEIDFEQFRITDSDSKKWGQYIGSHPLPILPINVLDSYKNVCISALSFYDQIAQNIPKDKVITTTGLI